MSDCISRVGVGGTAVALSIYRARDRATQDPRLVSICDFLIESLCGLGKFSSPFCISAQWEEGTLAC